MDFRLLNAMACNKLLSFLIIIQLSALMLILSLLIWPVMAANTTVLTVMSAACLLMICLPLLVFQYLNSKNREMRHIFLAMLVGFAFFSASGVVVYTFPQVFGLPWMTEAGKVLMLMLYPPIMIALFQMWKVRERRGASYVGTIVVIVNALAAALIILFVALNYFSRPGDAFNTVNYTLSIIGDIAILSMASLLAIIYMDNQFRYVLSLLFMFFLISLIGDTLSLLDFLDIYSVALLAEFVYDVMVIFAALALLFYSLGNIKVTTVEEVNRKLHDSRSLIEDLLLQSPVAMSIFDLNGTAMHANAAFLQFLGAERAEVIGRFNIFQDADRLMQGLGEKFSVARDGGMVSMEGDVPGSATHPESRYFLIRAYPAHDSEGNISGFIMILNDITDRRKHEEELTYAQAQAELYLDLMGHDINNMNQIGTGFLEIALDRLDLDSEGQMLIRKPLEAMRNSSRLIDNVKKIRRASMNPSDLKPVDLGAILGSVVEEYSNVRSRDAIIEYVPVRGCYVAANALIRDIFSNLVNNAFKHSSGPLKVWVKVTSFGDDRAFYHRVSIEDNGPGIPDDIKRYLRDPVTPFRTRTAGSGLGLYLVKTLVESFRGTITADDRVPGDRKAGTRICVTLPATGEDGRPALRIPPVQAGDALPGSGAAL
ncbi:MAG: sensory histidine kinase AtoS [Methanocella sp. PtaU1.Bin125]|nr:MAG: sensory histidine kinase AtoS [Methanocella sp. PtaU1.Bin125]